MLVLHSQIFKVEAPTLGNQSGSTKKILAFESIAMHDLTKCKKFNSWNLWVLLTSCMPTLMI